MISFFLCIALLGLLFGSLSTVLIDRWHSGKGGILLGRSECPKCRHRLSPSELIPVFSYIFQRGRCRHCSAHISFFYPIAEILMASIFLILTMSYVQNTFSEILSPSFFMLLMLGFVTGVYTLYDLRYMEIPDQIMVPAIYGSLSLLFLSLFFPDIESLFFDRLTYLSGIQAFIIDHIAGAWILYSFLYIQILIPGGWYLASHGRMRELLELIFSYIIFPFTLLSHGERKDISPKESQEESIPSWVGGGDLRVALFIGLTLGTLHGIASFAIAYIIGSIVGVILMVSGALHRRDQNQVPFGPFLAIGWLGAILFHSQILDIVNSLSL